METILLKYRGENDEYLVYDTLKFHDMMKPRAIRTICSRNCGYGTAGMMVGPMMEGGRLTMKMFSPEGEEKPMGADAVNASRSYLKDAGYIEEDGAAHAEAVGKIFLSEKFVKTYMETA